MIKGSIVILNSGGMPMTITDEYQDEKGIHRYECTWISPDGAPHMINVPAQCVHLASDDPVFMAQKQLQEQNLKQAQRQMQIKATQDMGLIKAGIPKKSPHA